MIVLLFKLPLPFYIFNFSKKISNITLRKANNDPQGTTLLISTNQCKEYELTENNNSSIGCILLGTVNITEKFVK